MTARSSEGMPARPGSMPPLAPPPVTDLRIARLLETADDENAAVDSLLDGADRLRLARAGVCRAGDLGCRGPARGPRPAAGRPGRRTVVTTAPTRPVSVEELKRAYRAVQAGAFRTGRPRTAEVPTWTPTGPVLTVVPAAAGVGATTLALALATAAGEARVVECASATASGLAAAPTAELGRDASGWLRGTRGPVSIERSGEVLASAGEVPLPLPAPAAGLTVVDLAWELAAVLSGDGWLTDLLTTEPSGGGRGHGERARAAAPRGGPGAAGPAPGPGRVHRRGAGRAGAPGAAPPRRSRPGRSRPHR